MHSVLQFTQTRSSIFFASWVALWVYGEQDEEEEG